MQSTSSAQIATSTLAHWQLPMQHSTSRQLSFNEDCQCLASSTRFCRSLILARLGHDALDASISDSNLAYVPTVLLLPVKAILCLLPLVAIQYLLQLLQRKQLLAVYMCLARPLSLTSVQCIFVYVSMSCIDRTVNCKDKGRQVKHDSAALQTR